MGIGWLGSEGVGKNGKSGSRTSGLTQLANRLGSAKWPTEGSNYARRSAVREPVLRTVGRRFDPSRAYFTIACIRLASTKDGRSDLMVKK